MPSDQPGRDLGQEFRDLEDLVQQLRQSLDELREIQDLARTIRSSVSPDEILEGLSAMLTRILPEPQLGLFLLTGEEFTAVGDPSLALRAALHTLLEDGITSWVLEERRPIFVPRLDGMEAEQSDLLVPLIVMSAGIGVLLVRSRQHEEELTPHQLDLLSFASGQAALALENSRLVSVLEESRRQLQDMIDNAVDLILLVDEEGRITYANARTEALDEPRERLVGRCLADFVPDPALGRQLTEEIRRGTRSLKELILRNPVHPPERLITAQLSFTPLGSNYPGNSVCMIILRDLSEQRRLEAQAREAESLKAVMLAAVTVNHEINNPLTAIVGNLFLLKRELGESATPEMLQRIELAERSAQQIQDVAHKLEQVNAVRRVRYLGDTDMLDIEPPAPAEGDVEEDKA